MGTSIHLASVVTPTSAPAPASTAKTWLQVGVPIGIAPSGTFGANGVFTPHVQFSVSEPDGCWLWYPANVISGANAAGFYWTVMDTPAQWTVYANLYTPGVNQGPASWARPATPLMWVGAQGTASVPATGSYFTIGFLKMLLPGNSLGDNGHLYIRYHLTYGASTASNKDFKLYLGGQNLFNYQTSSTVYIMGEARINNMGRVNLQNSSIYSLGSAIYGIKTTKVDTAVDNDMQLTFGLATPSGTTWAGVLLRHAIIQTIVGD